MIVKGSVSKDAEPFLFIDFYKYALNFKTVLYCKSLGFNTLNFLSDLFTQQSVYDNFEVIFFVLGFAIFLSCAQKNQVNVLNIEEITIPEMQKGFEEGRFTSVDVVQAYLDRIEVYDKNGPQLNSILQLNPDALTIAAQLDAERKAGKIRGPLHGIPVVLKDNIDTFDKMNTTAGARALKD